MTSPLLLSEIHRTALSNEWFTNLSKTIRDDVLGHTRRLELVAGERLFLQGDHPDGMFGVLEGCIRISSFNINGRETVLDFYGKGSWFGEVAALDGSPRIFQAEACARTVLLQLRSKDLETLLARHPPFSRALLHLVAQRLRLVLVAIEQYSTQSLEQRLANRMLMLASCHGVTTLEGLEIKLHIPQETLAQLIGATRQSVNAILKKWEFDGIVEHQYGRNLIRDKSRLEALAKM